LAKSSRSGVGRIAAAAVIIAMIVMVVGIGGFFGSQGPPVTLTTQTVVSTSQTSSPTSNSSSASSTTESTCTAAANVTATVGSSTPPCGCALVDSNSNGSLYVSPNPKIGDNVCVDASLIDSAQISLSITNSTGSVVFSTVCVATPPPGAPPPTGDTCTAFWNTANPDPEGNVIYPGTYHLVAKGSSATAQLEASFTLS
jgi:hypothetical protein